VVWPNVLLPSILAEKPTSAWDEAGKISEEQNTSQTAKQAFMLDGFAFIPHLPSVVEIQAEPTRLLHAGIAPFRKLKLSSDKGPSQREQ
jgi:hypothetical protein